MSISKVSDHLKTWANERASKSVGLPTEHRQAAEAHAAAFVAGDKKGQAEAKGKLDAIKDPAQRGAAMDHAFHHVDTLKLEAGHQMHAKETYAAKSAQARAAGQEANKASKDARSPSEHAAAATLHEKAASMKSDSNQAGTKVQGLGPRDDDEHHHDDVHHHEAAAKEHSDMAAKGQTGIAAHQNYVNTGKNERVVEKTGGAGDERKRDDHGRFA